jgi:hypothetical protein
VPAPPFWTDFVTSLATAGTLVAAAVGATVALLVYRRDARLDMPIVEPDFNWEYDPALGRCLRVSLRIVNRLDETLIIESATVSRPPYATISAAAEFITPSHYLDHRPTASSKRKIDLDWRIPPAGANAETFTTPRLEDAIRQLLYVLPPPSWNGGTLRITLRISSKALTIRARRTIIKRRLPASTSSETEETASKAG